MKTNSLLTTTTGVFLGIVLAVAFFGGIIWTMNAIADAERRRQIREENARERRLIELEERQDRERQMAAKKAAEEQAKRQRQFRTDDERQKAEQFRKHLEFMKKAMAEPNE